MTRHWLNKTLALTLACTACSMHAIAAEPAPPAAASAPDGIRHVPAFDLPVSEYLSPAARAHVAADVARVNPLDKADNASLLKQLPSIRADTERWAEGVIAQLRTRYAVEITPETWNGVPVLRVEPRTRTPEQAKRMLIELHGGSFVMGSAASFGLMEAIPLAAMTGMTVVAVDYRMGPEHHFPAASEDVAAVYRAALKTYAPERIGLFGCSAGGVLTGESLAWFAKETLPMPAAAGLFCAAGDARYRGDSRTVVAAVNDALLPDKAGALPIWEDLYYGDNVDFHDPLVSPVFSDAVLQQFPPTLFLTATRAAELSNAAYTHARLVDLGRESDLHVWDGLGMPFTSPTRCRRASRRWGWPRVSSASTWVCRRRRWLHHANATLTSARRAAYIFSPRLRPTGAAAAAPTLIRRNRMSLQIPQGALVVVADGGEARWFTNTGNESKVVLRQHARTDVQNVDDDGPAGKAPQDLTEADRDEMTFAKQLSHALNDGALKHEYTHLVLVADPTTLGRVRPLLHKETQQRLVGDLAKDLTNLPLEDIQRALS